MSWFSSKLFQLETERKITDLLMAGCMLKVTARYQVLLIRPKGLTGTNVESFCGLLYICVPGQDASVELSSGFEFRQTDNHPRQSGRWLPAASLMPKLVLFH